MKYQHVLDRLTSLPNDVTLPVAYDEEGKVIYLKFLGDPKFHLVTHATSWNEAEGDGRYEESCSILEQGVHPSSKQQLEEMLEAKGTAWTVGLAAIILNYWYTGEIREPSIDEQPEAVEHDEADEVAVEDLPLESTASEA